MGTNREKVLIERMKTGEISGIEEVIVNGK